MVGTNMFSWKKATCFSKTRTLQKDKAGDIFFEDVELRKVEMRSSRKPLGVN